MNTPITNGTTTKTYSTPTTPTTGNFGEDKSGTLSNQDFSKLDSSLKARASTSMSKEVSNLISDIEQLITANTSLSAEEISRIKEKISTRISSAREALEAGTRTATESARKAVTATNDYVSQEPWKAVGIGAGIGFLAGVLVMRR